MVAHQSLYFKLFQHQTGHGGIIFPTAVVLQSYMEKCFIHKIGIHITRKYNCSLSLRFTSRKRKRYYIIFGLHMSRPSVVCRLFVFRLSVTLLHLRQKRELFSNILERLIAQGLDV